MTETLNPGEPDLAASTESPVEPKFDDNDNRGSSTLVTEKDDSKSCNGNQQNSQSVQDAQTRPKNPESLPNTVQSVANINNVPQVSSQTAAEQLLQKSKRDLESMVLKYAKSERENLQNKNKVEDLEKRLKRAIKDNDQLANRIKLLTNDKNQLTDTLSAKVAQLTVLEQKNNFLSNAQGNKLKECEEKIKKLESSNEELLKQIETYKSKEGELLDFSERLSMKHMMLQSELNDALNKVPSCKEQFDLTAQERDNLFRQNGELSKRVELLEADLKKERENLKSLRNEKESIETKYRRNVDELQNEIKVMRRKHQIATKELVKGIKQLQVQLEKVEPAKRHIEA